MKLWDLFGIFLMSTLCTGIAYQMIQLFRNWLVYRAFERFKDEEPGRVQALMLRVFNDETTLSDLYDERVNDWGRWSYRQITKGL